MGINTRGVTAMDDSGLGDWNSGFLYGFLAAVAIINLVNWAIIKVFST